MSIEIVPIFGHIRCPYCRVEITGRTIEHWFDQLNTDVFCVLIQKIQLCSRCRATISLDFGISKNLKERANIHKNLTSIFYLGSIEPFILTVGRREILRS